MVSKFVSFNVILYMYLEIRVEAGWANLKTFFVVLWDFFVLFLEHVWVDPVSGLRHVCQEGCRSYWSLKTEQSKNDNSILNCFSLANTASYLKLELVVFKKKCVENLPILQHFDIQFRFFNQGLDFLKYMMYEQSTKKMNMIVVCFLGNPTDRFLRPGVLRGICQCEPVWHCPGHPGGEPDIWHAAEPDSGTGHPG